MIPNNEGLTVGELTITIGALIIAFLVWSGISKKHDQTTSYKIINDSNLLVKGNKILSSISIQP